MQTICSSKCNEVRALKCNLSNFIPNAKRGEWPFRKLIEMYPVMDRVAVRAE